MGRQKPHVLNFANNPPKYHSQKGVIMQRALLVAVVGIMSLANIAQAHEDVRKACSKVESECAAKFAEFDNQYVVCLKEKSNELNLHGIPNSWGLTCPGHADYCEVAVDYCQSSSDYEHFSDCKRSAAPSCD